MRITARKITDEWLMRQACDFTRGNLEPTSQMTLDAMYRCEHSPARTQLFTIEMRDIPTYVSVHLTRHKVGVEHFVQSNRNRDNTAIHRDTPINHMMLLNAQALINMSLVRLCRSADLQTRTVWVHVRNAVHTVDPDLAKYMVPKCTYRGSVCHELKPCGWRKHE